MSDYDPFQRGPHPVGVRSAEWSDESRNRTLPVEIWYPATREYAGQDLDDATRDHYKPMPMAPEAIQSAVRDAAAEPGARPLIVFSHGFGGERRQTTHLCTHWASHGYAVVAMDHVGNTAMDMMQSAMSGEASDPQAEMQQFIADRPADASFVIDRAEAGESGLVIDPERIGISGHSFGGWTTLATTSRDARIRAALPLAPAGGRTAMTDLGLTDDMANALDIGWDRTVETLYLVAEFDSLLPLDGMRDLLKRTPEPRSGINLLNADHFHFCDSVEETHDLFKTMGPVLGAAASDEGPNMDAILAAMKNSAELCPGESAYALLQGLGLAHMDSGLREDAGARAFLGQDLVAVMAERGVAIEML